MREAFPWLGRGIRGVEPERRIGMERRMVDSDPPDLIQVRGSRSARQKTGGFGGSYALGPKGLESA